MAEKARSYTKLKNSTNLNDFESFVKKVAIQYADSDGQFSSSYFMKAENISKSCFYKILDEAIVRNLVSEEQVDRMEAKAVSNQKSHEPKAGFTSQQHYAELRKKRNEYIFYLYSDVEIKLLAEDFALSTTEDKKSFAKRYDVSPAVVDALLKKAFINNIISDETCKLIEHRSVKKNPSKRTTLFFESLWNARRENKKIP